MNRILGTTSAGMVLGLLMVVAGPTAAQQRGGLPALSARVDVLEATLATVLDEVGARGPQLDDALARIGVLETDLAATQAALSAAEGRIGTLETDLAATQADLTAALGRIDDLETDVANLDAALDAFDIAGLTARVGAIEGNTVLDLDGFLFLDDVTVPALPRAVFEAINVQVRKGDPADEPDLGAIAPDGLGNLFVGFNLNRGSGRDPVCSDGAFDNQVDCENDGAVWAANHKSGSHNLVVGEGNAFSRVGGIVAGQANVINGRGATVTGGFDNVASGLRASVGGGAQNTASGATSSVGGGLTNTASGFQSSVGGGLENTASGAQASVSGGGANTASGDRASVAGGRRNTASGAASSVSGGDLGDATGNFDWVAGTLFEDD